MGTGSPTQPSNLLFNRLIFALTHPDEFVRAGAAVSLGKLAASDAVEHLVRLLQDPSVFVSQSAAAALALIDPKGTAALLAEVQSPATEVTGRHAAAALGDVRGENSVGMLAAALAFPEASVRWGAARALGRMGEPAAIEPLSKAAQHADPLTRQYAAEALGLIGREAGIQPLTTLLGDPEPEIRVLAVESLGKIGGVAVLEPLLTAVEDSSSDVREAAADALRGIRDPRAMDAFLIALEDPKPIVRMSAAEALSSFADSELIPKIYKRAYEEDELTVRLSAAAGLVRLGDERGRTILTRTMNAPNARARLLAALELGNIGDPRAAVPLLGDPFYETEPSAEARMRMRDRVIAALSSLGDPVLPLLIDALPGLSEERAKIAEETLEAMGEEAVPSLLEALETRPELAPKLIPLLGRIGDPRSVPLFIRTLDTFENLSGWVSSLGSRVYDPGVETRRRIIKALGELSAIPEERKAIAEKVMKSAIYDPDAGARRDAKRTIARLGNPLNVLSLASTGSVPIIRRGLISIVYLTLVCYVLAWGFASSRGILGLLGPALVTGAVWGGVDLFRAKRRFIQSALTAAGVGILLSKWALPAVALEESWGLPLTLALTLGAMIANVDRRPVRPRILGVVIGLGFATAAITVGVLVFG